MTAYAYRVYMFGRFAMHLVLTEDDADEIAEALDVIVEHRYRSIDWA